MTPINVDILEKMLIEEGYDPVKRVEIVTGFRQGFDIGYRGPQNIQQRSPNLKFNVGSEKELWNKVMKEIKLKRFAGPFKEIPYRYFIQSPIGLVPKDDGRDTRLIFHLSYPRSLNENGKSTSLNGNTPADLCKVKNPDITDAIRLCLAAGKNCFCGKSDFSAAFRNVNILKRQWKFLVMKAKSPRDQNWYYMVDKCLPFGSSRSCKIFQDISDCIAYLVMKRIQARRKPVNYLDDFLCVTFLRWVCNDNLRMFLDLCKMINFPVNLDKNVLGNDSTYFPWVFVKTR